MAVDLGLLAGVAGENGHMLLERIFFDGDSAWIGDCGAAIGIF